MNKEVLDYVVEKTHELIDAPTCSNEDRCRSCGNEEVY